MESNGPPQTQILLSCKLCIRKETAGRMCVVSSLCTPRSTALIPVLTTTTLRERRRWVLEYLRLCASRLLQSLPRGMQACLLWKVTRALKLQVCCGVLQCVAVCFSGRAVSCSVLECVAVCCSVLQCVAACCNDKRTIILDNGQSIRIDTKGYSSCSR